MRDCTDLFLHYREIARLVWNLGFCTKPELVEWTSKMAYDEALARLFEAMILMPLGYEDRVTPPFDPGKVVAFSVVPKAAGVTLRVNKNFPDDPARIWGDPDLILGSRPHRLRFIAFFDWDLLVIRDFRLLEVLIEEMEEMPDVVGKHALIEVTSCSIWLSEGESDVQ